MNPPSLDLEKLVWLASTYPSGDNAQPFRFRWDGSLLRIFYEPERGRHRLNPGHLLSWMTLGFLLECLDLAASEQGFSTEVVSLPIGERGCGPMEVAVRLAWIARSRDPLAEHLIARHTERRPFARSPDPLSEEKKLRSLGESVFEGGRVHFLPQPLPSELIRYILGADRLVWSDRLALQDLLGWMRVSRRDPRLGADGMPWSTLGVSALERRVLALAQRKPKVACILPVMGARRKARRLLLRQLKSCSGLGLVTVSDTGSDALLRAGRASLRSWLRHQSAGRAFHPLTLPAFGPLATTTGAWDPPISERFSALFAEGERILRKAFSLSPDEVPLWMFRSGLPPKTLPAARSPRRPLHEVLQKVGPTFWLCMCVILGQGAESVIRLHGFGPARKPEMAAATSEGF